MSSSNRVELVNIWCMLCLYPHHSALSPASSGPMMFPRLYSVLSLLWFMECASHPATTWEKPKQKTETAAYLVKQAVRKAAATSPMKKNYFAQFGVYRCFTFSRIFMYFLESLDRVPFPTSGKDCSIFSASSECKALLKHKDTWSIQ